jgi:hypothetical protein
MDEPTPKHPIRQRAPRGSKRGWQTRGAKFAPEEDRALVALADARGVTIDAVIHDAVLPVLAPVMQQAA